MTTKTTAVFFVPALFCAFISFMALFMREIARPAFYAFLPMCFFFAATQMVAMNKRIKALEDELRKRDGESA